MKKGKALLAIIITIVIMLLVFAGIVFAGIKLGVLKIDMSALNFGQENKVEEKAEENVDIYSKEYNVDDYVTVAKDEESGLKLVTFKGINSDVLNKFLELQNKFKDSTVESGNKKTNVVRNNADKGVLSVYTKETVKKGEEIVSEVSYAVNVNIEDESEVKNSELIKLYGTSIENISKAIVTKFTEISADVTYTDSSSAVVKASDIKANSSKYIDVLKDNVDKLVIYTRKEKLYVDVNSSQLMDLLGLKATDNTKVIEITSISI